MEKRRLAAAQQQTRQDSYTPVLVNGRRGVVGVFDFDTWTWDAQWDLWEDQLKPEAHANLAGDSTHAKLADDPKAKLLLFYLEEVSPSHHGEGRGLPGALLPVEAHARGPTVFQDKPPGDR